MLDQLDRKLSTLIKSLDDFCGPRDGLAWMQRWRSSEPNSISAHAENIEPTTEIRRAVEDLRNLHSMIISRKQSCEYLAKQVSVLFFSQYFD